MNERITVEVPDTVLRALQAEAQERGVSVEKIAADVLRSRAAAGRKTVLDVMDEVLDEFSELHQRLA